mgnify:CR=1 FL=1
MSLNDELNQLLAEDSEYVIWTQKVETEYEDEAAERAYTTWLAREEARLNPTIDEVYELVQF